MVNKAAKIKQTIPSSSRRAFKSAVVPLTPAAAKAYKQWEAELAIWRKDRQIMDLKDGPAHIELAQRLTPKYLEKSADILIRAGFAPAEDRDGLIARLAALPEKRFDDIADMAVQARFIKKSQHAACLTALKELPLHSDTKTIAFHLRVKGFIPAVQEPNFFARILTLPNEPRLQLNGAQFCWRVKGKDSVSEKLSESSINQDPGKIGDYWAATIIAEGIANVIRARQAIVDDPDKTSQKDYFQVPQDTGHRCFMSHVVVEDEKEIQTGEWQVTEARQDKICKFTHKLKDISRSLAEASRACVEMFTRNSKPKQYTQDKTATGLPTRLQHLSNEVEYVRTVANDIVNFQTGMNELAIPGYERYPETIGSTLSHKAKGFIRAAEDYSGVSFKGLEFTNKSASGAGLRARDLH